MKNYHPPFLNYFNALIKNQSIGRRLIINILIVSSLITLFSTIYQLYTDYNRDVNLIHQRMNQIQTSYLEGIINSIWMTDLNQAKILIQTNLCGISLSFYSQVAPMLSLLLPMLLPS